MAETEAILLNRFTKSGDAEAFGEIIRRHAGLVYGAALRVLADVDRASDVAQETFLQLTKDAGTVSGSLPGWLHRVATHKAIDQARREAARRHRESRYSAEQPRETGEWKEISPHVDEVLNELDPELREILIAHFLYGRTTRQLAELRHISQATVSRRIESGVEQLRLRLRRRGLIVAVGVLSALLGDNAVKAAPPLLLKELGKMALAGGSAALSTGGAAGTSSTLHSLVGGISAAVKTKAVAVAAVAVIGTGSVVMYREVTKSSSTGPAPAATESSQSASGRPPRRVASSSMAPESGSIAPAAGRSQAAEEWDAMMRAAASQASRQSSETPVTQSSGVQPQATVAVVRQEDTPPAGIGGMGGMMGMAGSPRPQEGGGCARRRLDPGPGSGHERPQRSQQSEQPERPRTPPVSRRPDMRERQAEVETCVDI
jgi:RNA polymerase sigma factor (sigma-70 family)